MMEEEVSYSDDDVGGGGSEVLRVGASQAGRTVIWERSDHKLRIRRKPHTVVLPPVLGSDVPPPFLCMTTQVHPVLPPRTG